MNIINEMEEYNFPDQESYDDALVGQLDIRSNFLLQESLKLVLIWIKYREDNYFDLLHKEYFIRWFLEDNK